jgi:potassium/hydrogen antiporter
MTLQIEIVLLVVSVLFFLSILAGKASSRLGVPALLLFLGVGMLCGSDGLGIQFEDISYCTECWDYCFMYHTISLVD